MMYRRRRVMDGEAELEQLLERVDRAVFGAARRVRAPYNVAGEFEGEEFDSADMGNLVTARDIIEEALSHINPPIISRRFFDSNLGEAERLIWGIMENLRSRMTSNIPIADIERRRWLVKVLNTVQLKIRGAMQGRTDIYSGATQGTTDIYSIRRELVDARDIINNLIRQGQHV